MFQTTNQICVYPLHFPMSGSLGKRHQVVQQALIPAAQRSFSIRSHHRCRDVASLALDKGNMLRCRHSDNNHPPKNTKVMYHYLGRTQSFGFVLVGAKTEKKLAKYIVVLSI